jgi:endoglucanase
MSMTIATPLSTSGRFIVDKNGKRVKLAGVNWYGASEDAGVPTGLDRVDRHALAELIAAQGFNSVRLPFSVWMVENRQPVDPKYISANPDLRGKNPLGIYDSCVNALTDQGLIVIPNCHLLDFGWCCSDKDHNGLWFNDDFGPDRFNNAWQTIAQRYASNSLVAGMDIKNEPRPSVVGGQTLTPTWGDRKPTDIAVMYTSVGNLIHQHNPNVLIICEGLSYATDLTDVAQHPIQLAIQHKVVYSMHDYHWFHQPKNKPEPDRNAYIAAMDRNGGYLLHQNTAPVWIGEFGRAVQPATGAEPWWGNLQAWLAQNDVDWCWWALNPTHNQSVVPRTSTVIHKPNEREPFGLLTQDWSQVGFPEIMTSLKAIMAPHSGPHIS